MGQLEPNCIIIMVVTSQTVSVAVALKMWCVSIAGNTKCICKCVFRSISQKLAMYTGNTQIDSPTIP